MYVSVGIYRYICRRGSNGTRSKRSDRIIIIIILLYPHSQALLLALHNLSYKIIINTYPYRQTAYNKNRILITSSLLPHHRDRLHIIQDASPLFPTSGLCTAVTTSSWPRLPAAPYFIIIISSRRGKMEG